MDRAELEAQYGEVWSTAEATEKFKFIGIPAPQLAVVEVIETGQKGSIMFQHMPRFYFSFLPDTK